MVRTFLASVAYPLRGVRVESHHGVELRPAVDVGWPIRWVRANLMLVTLTVLGALIVWAVLPPLAWGVWHALSILVVGAFCAGVFRLVRRLGLTATVHHLRID